MIIISAVAASLALLFSPPMPDVSELGLKVEGPGLAELTAKIRGRDDASCEVAFAEVTACVLKEGTEIYWMTEEMHPAHPAVLFRGYVEGNNELRFEERGWFGGDAGEAIDFFNTARDGALQPERP